MGQLSQREIETIVRKLAVEMVECKHHYRGWVMRGSERVALIHYSRGRKGLSGGSARAFSRDLGLSLDEAVEMGRCRISGDEYFEILASD